MLDQCLADTATKLMLKETNCTVPWIQNKSKICTATENIKMALKLFNDNIYNQKRICKRPCETVEIRLNPPVEMYASFVKSLDLVFKDTIKVTEEYFLQNELSLFGNIGGYLGLSVGLSILNLRDLIGYLLERLVFSIKRQ